MKEAQATVPTGFEVGDWRCHVGSVRESQPRLSLDCANVWIAACCWHIRIVTASGSESEVVGYQRFAQVKPDGMLVACPAH